MEFGGVEEVGTGMWISLSRSLGVKGRQESAGYSPPDDMERQRPEGTGWMQGDKSELGFNKKRLVLIAQRMLIVAMCEIDF